MAKKSNSLMSQLYLIGMALVVVGFCCPMFSGALGSSGNGFKFIDFDKGSFVSIGALLIIVGAIAGIVFCFINVKKAPMSLKLLALAVSILGGVILVIGFTQNGIYKAIAKNMLKHTAIGFWLIIVGWVVAAAGKVTSKD